MKKIFAALLLGMITIGFMTSCSSGNSPSAVVKKNFECIKNKDIDGILKLTYLDDIASTPEGLERAKSELTQLMEKYVFPQFDEKGGIKSCEIINEDVSDNPEPGSIAFVTLKTILNNGEESESKAKLIMDKAGNWKLTLGN